MFLIVSNICFADDMYYVTVDSRDAATRLESAGIDPLLKVDNGYLVLAKQDIEETFSNLELEFKFIAGDVDRQHLALDMSMDDSNAGIYPVIYEKAGIRLFRVEPQDIAETSKANGLAPVHTENLRIIYKEPISFDFLRAAITIDVDSIISLISQDSIQSYLEQLQAFPPRVTGSASDYNSRDWCVSKLQDFGYTAVELDSFVYGSNDVQNVVAYQEGISLPDHQIVIGAHRDAVSGSPGADDDGSGTAGVLEIARVLKNIETQMTFVFILFDGEEQGLNGSWHYADEAAANGDSIVFMINMDMIGAYQNSGDVNLFHGSNTAYAQLFNDLADTIPQINLTGHLSNSSGNSDHYPFQQNGYDIVFAHEYIFSSVYHSYQDSTSYIDFDYATRVVKGALATAWVTDNSYIPVPGLTFAYPNGFPEDVPPGQTTTFQVQVDGSSGGTPVPGSGELHYSVNGGGFTTVPMTHLGSNLYNAELPAQTCSDNYIEFYVSAQESGGSIFNDPDPSNPNKAIIATQLIIAFEDDFESDKGWSVSGGLWARGTPTGNGGQYGNPDPNSGHNSLNVFGYNLNGDYENDLPERHLTSPPIDCSGLLGVRLKFWRWLGVEQPTFDHAYLRVSNNGTTWTTIWENSAEVSDNSWQELEYDISAIADDQSNVFIRFTMGTTDPSWQYCGWNIDDLEVSAYECLDQTDSDGDGIADGSDNCPLTYNPLQEDYDGDLIGDSCDLCTDSDNDGYGDPGFPINTCDVDNCPTTYNPNQEDYDGDSVGDSCDNCIYTYNPDQADSDSDGIGDACDWICGDADASGAVDIDDVVYLIQYIFASGPAPQPIESGDADCSGSIDIDDAVFLIQYIFSDGNTPCDPDGDGLPDC